jgi:hypothetical protein
LPTLCSPRKTSLNFFKGFEEDDPEGVNSVEAVAGLLAADMAERQTDRRMCWVYLSAVEESVSSAVQGGSWCIDDILWQILIPVRVRV